MNRRRRQTIFAIIILLLIMIFCYEEKSFFDSPPFGHYHHYYHRPSLHVEVTIMHIIVKLDHYYETIPLMDDVCFRKEETWGL